MESPAAVEQQTRSLPEQQQQTAEPTSTVAQQPQQEQQQRISVHQQQPEEWKSSAATTEQPSRGEEYLGRTYGYSADIEHTLPRHVGSRIMTTAEGDTVWRPATDVFETRDDLVVHCDLPGVPKEDISVDLRGDELWISGEHKDLKPFESASSRVRERMIGKFRKIVRLPTGEVKRDEINATCANGLLEIIVPKTEQVKGRKIAII